jgi:hypothetical protein
MTQCRYRSTGSLGSVPRLHRYHAALRLPAVHRSSLAFTRFDLPASSTGDDRISQVPGQPLLTCRLLGPRRPAGPRPTGILMTVLCAAVLPSTGTIVSASRPLPFRGSITRPARPLSTLRSQGHPWATQDSLSDGGRVPPVGTPTHGLLRSVSAFASSSPRLGLAQCPQGGPAAYDPPLPLKRIRIRNRTSITGATVRKAAGPSCWQPDHHTNSSLYAGCQQEEAVPSPPPSSTVG